jgi:amino acid transporter
VFSSDALSSVAYAPEAVLLVLLAAGTAALGWAWPISIAIVVLLAIVATSYRQTIFAYPSGGGSYIVAHENLGPLPGLAAAAALAVGYILTVSVSIAAGVDALISAVQPLAPYRVLLALGAIAVVTLLNLRGIRDSGTIFAVPTYAFLAAMYGLIGVGLVLYFAGRLNIPPTDRPHQAMSQAFGLFLVLRAFATGSTVMTGTEATSNGVPAFKPPGARNAAQTLTIMATILGTMFVGLTFLLIQTGVVPAEDETTISQLARGVFGNGPLYYLIQASTVPILVLAANTAYADFPRLASLLARDNYAPHQFAYRARTAMSGSRSRTRSSCWASWAAPWSSCSAAAPRRCCRCTPSGCAWRSPSPRPAWSSTGTGSVATTGRWRRPSTGSARSRPGSSC